MSAPPLSYIICTTARSGSNLLCDYLSNAGCFGEPWEYFAPGIMRDGHAGKQFQYSGGFCLDAYIQYLKQSHSSENGVFGFKILYEDFIELIAFPAFQELFENSAKIFLNRRSIISQAVSYYFAQQTGQWLASDEQKMSNEDVEFDFDALSEILDNLSWQTGQWRKILNCFCADPLEICTEEMVRAPSESLSKIANLFGISRPDVVRATLAKQSSSRKADIEAALSASLRLRYCGRMPHHDDSYLAIRG